MIIAFYPGAGGNRYLQKLLGNGWAKPHRSYDLANAEQRYEHRYLIDSTKHPASQYTLTHCMNSKRIQQVFPGVPIVFINSGLQASLQREWVLHGHQRFVNKNTAGTVPRLSHYVAIKDPQWPELDSEDQLDTLPLDILQEVKNDYTKVINASADDVPGVLLQLTRNIIGKINSAYEIITWHQQYYQTYPVDFSAATQIINIDTDDNEFSLVMKKEINLYQSEIFNDVWSKIND
jgi:hypothetical protein